MGSTAANKPDSLTITIDRSEIEQIAEKVQHYYAEEFARKYALAEITEALWEWFRGSVAALTADAAEAITTPGREESREFRSALRKIHETSREAEVARTRESESSVFTGFRPFSADRLAAMALYVAEKGKDIYKTKLNKLLFYSDFVNFHLHGRSISGAKYIHVPFGPVPRNYGEVLEKLEEAGRVRLIPAGVSAVLVKPIKKAEAPAELEPEEKATIDWVLANYGAMSASEIVEASHREKAYRFTRPGEEISYKYSAFLETLPRADH